MDNIHKQSFLPDLRVVYEEMLKSGWACQAQMTQDLRFRGVRLYHGQELDPKMLYVLEDACISQFPTDSISYISATHLPGKADHICCVDHSAQEILEFLQAIYETYQAQKERLDQLITEDSGLSALCALGEELLGNPVFIHDDWFVIIAKSPTAPQLLPAESYNDSALEYLPKIWLEDFKFDSEYQKTYSTTAPCIWSSDSPAGPVRSLYVNLTEGSTYRGRLLAVEHNYPFRARDFALMEQLHDHAMVIMRCRQHSPFSKLRSMDRLVTRLLEGDSIPAADESTFLSTLHWRMDDPLICIRLESQQRDGTALLERTLHSALFEKLAHSYILYSENQQCVILNLEKNSQSISMLSYMLSPLCRDYFHYAGISSPVRGIRELSIAYKQAGIALESAFQVHGPNWVVPFSACALDYMLTQLKPPIQLRHLIAPQLLQLLEYDKEKETQYFETLRTYLVMERDIPKSSEALIIHRTTLLYRLKKIQSIIGISLDDPDTRLYLLLSLKMMELEKRIPPLP